MISIRKYIRVRILGYTYFFEGIKLAIILMFALISLLITLYAYWHRQDPSFPQIYILLPHLYLIPIILVGLWYPKRGLIVTVLMFLAIFILSWAFAIRGYPIDPIGSILNSGLDIAVFVVLALYIKDRQIVDLLLAKIFSFTEGPNRVALDVITADAYNNVEGAFEDLLKALESPDDEIREDAVKAIGEINDIRAVRPLIRRLNDRDRFIRRESAKILGHLGDLQAISHLIGVLGDEDRSVREAAAEALGAIGTPAVNSLFEALKNPVWQVKVGAIVALRIIGDKRAIPPLINSLEDQNRFVRREAVKSLGRIGDLKVLEPLSYCLDDFDSGVRLRAVSALFRCGGLNAKKFISKAITDDDAGVRLKAIHVLEKIYEDQSLK